MSSLMWSSFGFGRPFGQTQEFGGYGGTEGYGAPQSGYGERYGGPPVGYGGEAEGPYWNRDGYRQEYRMVRLYYTHDIPHPRNPLCR